VSTGDAVAGWRSFAPMPTLVRMRELGELGRRQAGVVTRQQALACGMTVEQIRTRLRTRRWRRLFAGVYATFTGEIPHEAVLWAAVLSAGAGAVLSHQTAAALVGLDGTGTPGCAIHVTVPRGRRVQRRSGVALHVSARVDAARHPTRTPPQTRVEETVVDLTQTAPDLDAALSWIIRACAARLTTVDRLRATLAQRRKLRWRAELCATVDDVRLGSHSLLELRYLRDVERRHALPDGVRQRPRWRPGGRWYDDVCYPEYATAVELDGRAAHPEHRRRRDRKRDNAHVVAGGRVLHYDLADVTESPCDVAAEVAMVLRRNGWPGTPKLCRPHCTVHDRGG
jgi:very-short-patch-repair endonuclease